jgi:hypothetical protein
VEKVANNLAKKTSHKINNKEVEKVVNIYTRILATKSQIDAWKNQPQNKYERRIKMVNNFTKISNHKINSSQINKPQIESKEEEKMPTIYPRFL